MYGASAHNTVIIDIIVRKVPYKIAGLIDDTPDNSAAVGVPATIIKKH